MPADPATEMNAYGFADKFRKEHQVEDNFTLSKVLQYHQAQLNHLSQCLKEGDAALPTASERGNERHERNDRNDREGRDTQELKSQI